MDITVTLSVKMCQCGGFYAVPHWLGDYQYECPMCAKRESRTRHESYDEAIREQIRMSHVINGLRGALKKRR
jgi:hypothetical protein